MFHRDKNILNTETRRQNLLSFPFLSAQSWSNFAWKKLKANVTENFN